MEKMEANDGAPRPPIPLNTGGPSDAQIAADEKKLAAAKAENQRRLDELRQRDPEIARACVAALEQTRFNGSRLDAVKVIAKVISEYEERGAELVAEQRKRLAANQSAESAAPGSPGIVTQSLRIHRARALEAAKLHPLRPMEIVSELRKLGVNYELRGERDELWLDAAISAELTAQIEQSFDAFLEYLRNRWQKFEPCP